ncbi:MAG: sensor histidine kinase, partial [Actinomycetota bacterium]
HGHGQGHGGDGTWAWVWPDGVDLAVGNVVRNAVVHALPPNGSPARIAVSVDGPTVTVDDNGGGIAPPDRARLMERFERRGASAGTGLGLAIARQVTLAHGGSIELGDSPLGGTRVRLRFAPPDPGLAPGIDRAPSLA